MAYHHVAASWEKTIVFGATIVGGAFVLYSHLSGLDQKRAERAESLCARWQTKDLADSKDIFAKVKSGSMNAVDYACEKKGGKLVLPTDMDTRRKIVALLDFAEEAALAVREDRADEGLIKDYMEEVLVGLWRNFKDWVEKERRSQEEAGDSMYIELQNLLKKWKRIT
ncbi:MAG: DUF4760 domain-containing protein [Acidobacteria bacterium]|nr:DUF4760 domain-containing protein [Acidobacteriota bacterium]